mgnify:CR=1 FL=1
MYKILVADDEIKIRNTINDYLTAKGLSVITASDGEDAVEKTEETETKKTEETEEETETEETEEAILRIRSRPCLPELPLRRLRNFFFICQNVKRRKNDDKLRISTCYKTAQR